MSRLDENLRVAREAIRYINSLDIVSSNVPFRPTYYKFPTAKLDNFIFSAMRAGGNRIVNKQRQNAPEAKQRRAVVLSILREEGMSKSERQQQLRELMRAWGDDYFTRFTWLNDTQHPDEVRVRRVRKAIKFRRGNCGEKSAVIAQYLFENAPTDRNIVWVSLAKPGDHAFVVFDYDDRNWHKSIDLWDDDTLIVDGWTGDYYQAQHPYLLHNGNPLANPFQLNIRRMIQSFSGSIECMEFISERKRCYAPNFTLEVAKQPNRTYTFGQLEVSQGVKRHNDIHLGGHRQWNRVNIGPGQVRNPQFRIGRTRVEDAIQNAAENPQELNELLSSELFFELDLNGLQFE